jgi:predicted aspartyl protease
MLIGALVLFSTAMVNRPPTPVFTDLYIGDRGPYRFLVDTGAQTTLIDRKLAAELQLKAEFQVDVLTQNTTRKLDALRSRALRIGNTALPETEMVIDDLSAVAPIRGLLGLNALRNLNFSLTPKSGRLDLEGERPEGAAVPLRPVAGRVAVQARMGDQDLVLALDSGAAHVALFRLPAAMVKTPPLPTVLTTVDGARSAVPTTWTKPMTLGALELRTLPAAILERKDADVDGLLPASVFKVVYIDQRRGEAVLVR